MRYQTTFSLLGKRGERKYLNAKERASFYKACQSLPLDRRLFCELLFFTGARISEIYELTVDRVDLSDRTVILRTLKQRRNNVYRQIHIPDHLIEALTAYIAQCKAKTLIKSDEDTLWNFSLRTGYRAVKNVNAKVGYIRRKIKPKRPASWVRCPCRSENPSHTSATLYGACRSKNDRYIPEC